MDSEDKGPNEGRKKPDSIRDMPQLKALSKKLNFLDLIMSYPMRLLDQRQSRIWSKEVISIFVRTGMKRVNSLSIKYDIDASRRLLSEYVHLMEPVTALLPKDMSAKMCGVDQEFADMKCSEEASATLLEDNSRNIEVKQGAYSTEEDEQQGLQVPQAISELAEELALQQLVKTLIRGDVRYVRVLTRYDERVVTGKIEQALNDPDKVPQGIFSGILFINTSKCQGNEDLERECIKNMLVLEPQTQVVGKKIFRKYVVLLEGSTENFDLRQVLPANVFGAVVCISTGVLRNPNTKTIMDLEIREEDHLLPWEFFCRTVGSSLLQSSPAILKIAVSIVMECRGHLLALRIIAEQLKDAVSIEFWEFALQKLQAKNALYEIEESRKMSRVMVNAFMYVWEQMEYTTRHCLLQCLSSPEICLKGIEYSSLISNWDHVGYDRNTILQVFLSHAFLLDMGAVVRLPEEIYTILGLLDKYHKQAGLVLLKTPTKEEEWQSAQEIQLLKNEVTELPESPDCPNLKILNLHDNNDLMIIPTPFFSRMPLLTVVDLSNTSIQSLPNSFYELPSLQVFVLRGCELFMQLSPQIGKVKNLEKLDLEGTLIEYLPREVRRLTNLTSLNLSFHGYDHQDYGHQENMAGFADTIIPPKVISELKELSVLSVDVNPDDERWDAIVEVIIREVSALRNLKDLNLFIPDVKVLKLLDDAQFQQLYDFKFIFGYHAQRILSRLPPEVEACFQQQHRSIRFINGMDIPLDITKLLANTYAFFLDRHVTVKSLTEFGTDIRWLRFCLLAECNEMQTVFDGGPSSSVSTEEAYFQMEYLAIYFMKNLTSICKESTSDVHLNHLKFLRLNTCPELRTIFNLNLLQGLSNLEELIVEDCPNVEYIVNIHELPSGKIIEDTIFLPKLKKLALIFLDELVSISYGVVIGPELENLTIYDCPKLDSLSKAELSSKNLKMIRGETQWWEALKWSISEWGLEDRPQNLHHIFFPFDKDADIWTQL